MTVDLNMTSYKNKEEQDNRHTNVLKLDIDVLILKEYIYSKYQTRIMIWITFSYWMYKTDLLKS